MRLSVVSTLYRSKPFLSKFLEEIVTEFNNSFSYEALLSIGIVVNQRCLYEMFAKCSHLSWLAFDHTKSFQLLPISTAVKTSFKSFLQTGINFLFECRFFLSKLVDTRTKICGNLTPNFIQRFWRS